MENQDSQVLAIQLAKRVLEKDISVDFGLVRAHATGILVPFVENLNKLAGGDYFDPSVMRERVDRGTSGRAVAGRTEPYKLPEELEGWSLEWIEARVSQEETQDTTSTSDPESGQSEPPDEEFRSRFREGIENLDRKVKELVFQKEEVSRLLFFLEKVGEKRTDPPRPWIGSVVILIVASFLSGIAFLILGSPIVPGILFVGSAFLAAFLFQREYAWYERLAEIERADTEHRNRNIQLHKKQIEDCNREIREIRKEAHLRLLNLEETDKDRASDLKGEFPSLFSK